MAASHNPSAGRLQQLSAYDYVRFLSRSRIAWEYLRRHPSYKRDWRAASARPQPVHLSDGTVLLRARRRYLRAEAWGMYIFRRSS
jgi:transcriptional regulator